MNVVDIPTRTPKPLKPKTTSNILHWTEYWVNFSSKSLNSDGNPTRVEWKNKNILIFLLPLGWSTSWSQVLQFIGPSKFFLSYWQYVKTTDYWNLLKFKSQLKFSTDFFTTKIIKKCIDSYWYSYCCVVVFYNSTITPRSILESCAQRPVKNNKYKDATSFKTHFYFTFFPGYV